MSFDPLTLVVLLLCFVWSGFLRAGLGMGAAALMLPFALFVVDSPLVVIPLVMTHTIFLSTHTAWSHRHAVDWPRVGQLLAVSALPVAAGIYGLVTLPDHWLTMLVYGITLIYALSYIFPIRVKRDSKLIDLVAITIGGYITGVSFTGGPPIAAVAMKYIPKVKLRNSLLALWITIASAKLIALYLAGVSLQPELQLYMIPAVLIGHVLGLHFHDRLLHATDRHFYRVLGVVLFCITLIGIWRTLGYF